MAELKLIHRSGKEKNKVEFQKKSIRMAPTQRS